jgi:hypothetical protein
MKSSFIHMIIWVSICLLSIISYALWYSVIVNTSAAVAELQNQIDTKTETATRISAARTILSEIAGDELMVQRYFVPETGVVSFINDLEKRAHAQSSAMSVLSVSVDDSTRQKSLVLSLLVSGSFDDVMRTVGAIEYAPYDLSILKISLVKNEKKVWGANLDLIVGSVPDSAAERTKEPQQKVVSYNYP